MSKPEYTNTIRIPARTITALVEIGRSNVGYELEIDIGDTYPITLFHGIETVVEHFDTVEELIAYVDGMYQIYSKL